MLQRKFAATNYHYTLENYGGEPVQGDDISRLAYAPMAVKNYGFGALTPVRPWAPIALAHLSN